MTDDRINDLLAQTREELVEIKSGQKRLEEKFELSAARMEADIRLIYVKLEQQNEVSNIVTDHERRVTRIEGALWKIVMVVIVGVVSAVMSLVVKS